MKLINKEKGEHGLDCFVPKDWLDEKGECKLYFKLIKINELPEDKRPVGGFVCIDINDELKLINFHGSIDATDLQEKDKEGDFIVLLYKNTENNNDPKIVLNQTTALIGLVAGQNSVDKELLFQPFNIHNHKKSTSRISRDGWKPVYTKEYGPHLNYKTMDLLKDSINKINEIQDDKLKGNILKSIYWYNEALAESSDVTKFIKFFIALETLCKEKPITKIIKNEKCEDIEIKQSKPILDSIAEELERIHQTPDIKSKFKLSKLSRIRALVAHHGRNPQIDFCIIQFIHFIFIDILNFKIGLKESKFTSIYLDDKKGFFAKLNKVAK